MRVTHYAMSLMAAAAMLMSGCANQRVKTDYTDFRLAKPQSILVLPPLNDTPDVNASFSMLSQVTYPLAESGYYVMPVSLVAETFKQNGLSNAPDIHAVAPAKLKEIFGADAALYIKITQYGATYTVFNSVAVVSAQGQLIDLRSGKTLWQGSASASNNEGGNNSGGGLAGMLVAAIVKQVLNTATNASHPVAGVASNRLLTAGTPNGLLYGPRSPNYGKDAEN